MSIDLYHRRLSYHAGRGGIAKEGRLSFVLDAPPLVMPRALDIEFGEIAPGDMAWQPYVREQGHGQKRDMTPPEILLVRGWLASLLSAFMALYVTTPTPQERRKP